MLRNLEVNQSNINKMKKIAVQALIDSRIKEIEIEKQTKTINKKCKDRERYYCKGSKCKARIWNSGRGGQC